MRVLFGRLSLSGGRLWTQEEKEKKLLYTKYCVLFYLDATEGPRRRRF